MITELSDISMADFIRMLNGDYRMLVKGHKHINPVEIAKVVRKLSYDFQMIADTAAIMGAVSAKGEMIHAQCILAIYLMADAAYSIGDIDLLKSLLNEIDVNTDSMTDEQLKRHVLSELAITKRRCHRLEVDIAAMESTESKDKVDFSAITASMMSYYKFQIDLNIISASVYAHLIKQMKTEIREKTHILKQKG